MRALLLALSAALILAACTGGEDPPSPSPSASSPTATPTPTADGTEIGLELSQTCTFTDDGVEVAVPYPAGWHTNATDATGDGSAMPPCRVFHHEPFELPRASEVTAFDYFVRVEEVPYERVTAGDDPMHEVLTTSETEVDGLPAIVRELRANEDGISGPEGARHSLYAVDLGDDRTLIAVTYEVGDLDYARNKDLLDRVMEEITITQGDIARACSASGADVADAPSAQPDLPSEVADMRARIHQAAVACDFERLASLTSDQFTYSFGDSGDPAGYWRRLEAEGEQGEQPMRYLAGLLNRPYGTVTVEGRTSYVWPSAFAYASWEDVPERDREALKPLYDEQDFADWDRFGGYIGYRIGITEDGEWETFVAGD